MSRGRRVRVPGAAHLSRLSALVPRIGRGIEPHRGAHFSSTVLKAISFPSSVSRRAMRRFVFVVPAGIVTKGTLGPNAIR